LYHCVKDEITVSNTEGKGTLDMEMNTMFSDSAPHILYMDLDKLSTTNDSIMLAIAEHAAGNIIKFIDNWGDLIDQLNHHRISLLIINQNAFKEFKFSILDTVEMINTMSKFRKNTNGTPISVLIEDTKCGPDFIKELKSCNVSGIIPNPNKFPNLSSVAISDLLNVSYHWPKEFLKEINNKKKKQKENSSNPEEHLTSRQHQIYELISQRGLSNKQIANSLKISESTVKIHVSAIMKSFCVRNRTQLALSAMSIFSKN
jgi:DNA-binding NarL/FixJ family response regulator